MKIVKQEIEVYYANDGFKFDTIEQALERDKLLSFEGTVAYVISGKCNDEIIPVKVLKLTEPFFRIEIIGSKNIEDYISTSLVFKTYEEAKLKVIEELKLTIAKFQHEYVELGKEIDYYKSSLLKYESVSESL